MSESYPFLEYLKEDKSRYKHAKDCGYIDDDDLFLIGDSGGFLMNINYDDKFINTEEFTRSADYYIDNKNRGYTNFKVDSIPHRQFRKREQYRRKYGYKAPCLLKADGTIKEVRITGSHYNFLNYTRMEMLNDKSIKQGNTNTAEKFYSFPKFIDSQFWVHHIMEFAEKNGFNLLIDKTRRGGFSYMMAADSSNTVNNEPRKVVIHVANDSKYLTMRGGLTDFTINNLKFLEEKSPFKRGILSPKAEDFRLGYKLPNNVEADNSWHSSLLSVSAFNNPDCAIGKDAKKVKAEEVSTMEDFDEFMTVTAPTMRTGAYTTGILIAWGTATSGNMQTFELNFYNPRAFNFMPFENVWDKDARHEVCGFFKPYVWGLEGEYNGLKGVDENGNSNIEVSLEIARQERIKQKSQAKTYGDYIAYLGQYAISPSESFSNASENIFTSEELRQWCDRLKIDTDLHFYVDGMLVEDSTGTITFKSNERLRKENETVHDYIVGVPRKSNEQQYGCIRMWFPPEYEIETLDTGGIRKYIPKGRYSISYDPVGVDKDGEEVTTRHSHNSIGVWMNPCKANNFKQKLVAVFYGRHDKLEEDDRICYLLAKYYNCLESTNVEINRGETVSNFKKWRAIKYLGFEPLFIWDKTIKEKYSKDYGFSITEGIKKLEAIRLLKEMLYEQIGIDENGNPIRMFHKIYDYQTILELIKWNAKGNFDRVSQLLIRAIEYKGINSEAIVQYTDVELTEENIDENDILNREWF